MAKKKIRPLGEITLELEELVLEMIEDHELQAHEIIGIQYAYIRSHAESAIECYEDGKKPVLFYGHPDSIEWKE